MKQSISWRFPPTNGGRADGFIDPGIAHFSGSPLRSLARETVQNSMDARKSSRQPVSVSFELIRVKCSKELGLKQLAEHVEACIAAAEGDIKAKASLQNAYNILQSEDGALQFLRVSDQKTTGLRNQNWRALVKMQGMSVKDDAGAGGSFGIGKYAPFDVSPLRTVCYWTCFNQGTRVIEKFQGKAVLMSHKFRTDSCIQETQGTGFFGHIESCAELTGSDIPDIFRLLDSNQQPIQGTALWIAGFQDKQFSQREIAQSVVENFFYAVDRRDLVVIVEPDSSSEDPGIEISSSTLDKWFKHLLVANESNGGNDDERSGIREAKIFSDLMRGQHPTLILDDPDLGQCKLWIRVGDALPCKVALIRGTGMLITTQQRGLMRFPGLQDFAAVCMFDSPEGNALLRQMENPQHDRLEPDRLPDGDRVRGHNALKRVTGWIREKVKEQAALKQIEAPEELSELAALLPDLEAPGPFNGNVGESEREKALGVTGEIKYKPPKRRIKPVPLVTETDDDDEEDDGDGAATGTSGGSGVSHGGNGGSPVGPGEGDGKGGTGSRGGSRGRELLEIRDVRVLRSPQSSNRHRVSFTPGGSGTVRIDLAEAGDSSAIPRTDLNAFEVDGKPLSLDAVSVIEGQRKSFDVTGQSPMNTVAWRIIATKEKLQ